MNTKERRIAICASVLFLIASILRISIAIAENSEFVPIAGGTWNEGIVGQPIALNPIISSNQADQDISALIYSRLYDLLETYDIAKDKKNYTLKLKKDLVWDDGTPLTSNDVIFTIKTIQDADVQSPFAQSWQGVSAERLSELQVRFSLPTPYAFFTENIKRLPLIPMHIFGTIPAQNIKLSAYNLEPVGNGPYRIKDFKKRKDGFITEYHLVPNEKYHSEQPLIKHFFFKFYETEEKRTAAFRMRKINGIGNLNTANTSLSTQRKTIIERISMPRYYTIFINQNINPALKEKDLRLALSLSINKERIVKELGNTAAITHGPFVRNEQQSSYDLNAAKEYLKKVYPVSSEAKAQNIELNLVVPNVDFLKKAAEQIKNDWLALGIAKVNIIELNPDDIVSNVLKARNYEMVLFGNVLENNEDLFPFWHSSQRFYPDLNLSLYQNAKADTIMETIRQNTEEINKEEEKNKLETLITEDVPALFLFTMPYTYLHTKNLSGFGFASQNQEFLITPADRFRNINQWYVLKARVLK